MTQNNFLPYSPHSLTLCSKLSTNLPLRCSLIIMQCLHLFSQTCFQPSINYEDLSSRLSYCERGSAAFEASPGRWLKMVFIWPIKNPFLLKGYPPLRGQIFSLGWARSQDWLWFSLEWSFESLPGCGEGCLIKRTSKYTWLWEDDSPLGKPITFLEPCYIHNFSPFMAHIKWLELPHTFPLASLKIVQPCSGLQQW